MAESVIGRASEMVAVGVIVEFVVLFVSVSLSWFFFFPDLMLPIRGKVRSDQVPFLARRCQSSNGGLQFELWFSVDYISALRLFSP